MRIVYSWLRFRKAFEMHHTREIKQNRKRKKNVTTYNQQQNLYTLFHSLSLVRCCCSLQLRESPSANLLRVARVLSACHNMPCKLACFVIYTYIQFFFFNLWIDCFLFGRIVFVELRSLSSLILIFRSLHSSATLYSRSLNVFIPSFAMH